MRNMDESKRVEPVSSPEGSDKLDAIVDSPALQRLLEEVRCKEDEGVPRSYNRTFNRHNR